MPPKRAKTAGGALSGTKRVKSFALSDSDSGLPTMTKPQKKAAALKTLPVHEDTDGEDEGMKRQLKIRQQQLKPKKKGSSNSTPAQEPTYTKPQQQQSTLMTSLSKQPTVLKSKSVNFSKGNQENQENQAASKNSGINPSNTKDDGKALKKSIRPSGGMSTEQLEAAYEDLNTKHRRLKQLRETEAERNLDDCRAKLEESTRSAENYRLQIEPQLESALRSQEKLRDNNEVLNAKVRTLQRQVREYEEKSRQRDLEEQIKAKTASMESVLASPDVTPSSAGTASTIKMYENLSGFKIVPQDIYPRSSKDALPKVWDCEHTGPHGTLRFTLTYDYTGNNVSYHPFLDEERDMKLLEVLPDYLTGEIDFERQFESKFFWRILNFNHETIFQPALDNLPRQKKAQKLATHPA